MADLYDEMMYPGHGFPKAREGGPAASPSTPWARLCKGQPLGKKTVVKFSAGPQPSPVSILQVQGDDADAQNITVTLSPPQVIPLAFASIPDNIQGMSGEQTNAEILNLGNFPGLAHPLNWPEIYGILEWGCGGTQERVEIDLLNGLTANLCASFVRLRAVIGNTTTLVNTSGYISTPGAYVLSAFIGPGWTRPGNAQRTIYVGALGAGGESDTFAVPRFAKRVTVFSGDFATAPEITIATIRFWGRADAGVGKPCLGNFLFTGNSFQPVNIPNGAMYFSILSGMSGAHMTGALFDLAI
jgi:hypothetical protein